MKNDLLNTRPMNQDERLTLDVIDYVNETLLAARKLKAVTRAFADAFTECASGADWEEVRQRPEHFCYLFSALESMVFEVEEQAQAAEEAGGKWIEHNRAQRETDPAQAV